MIGGMLPSAFGLGSGGEFRAPMAIAVIGGLLSSMLLSLLFVPPVFSVMDDIAGMIWGYFRRCVGEADEPAEPARPTPRRTGAANAQGLPIAAEEKPGRRRGKSTEPPARIRRVAGPHRLPLGGCLRPARRIPCSMVESCSISSCAATRDRKIGAHRPAPKIWLICWPNSPLAVGKARHLWLPWRGFQGAAAVSGPSRGGERRGEVHLEERSYAASPPAPRRLLGCA